MEFSKLKNLLRENGDKVIFMENGEPEMVMMSFAEYEKLARLHLSDAPKASHSSAPVEKMRPEPAPAPEDIPHETEFVAPMEIAPIRLASVQGQEQFMRGDRHEARMSDIRLEDLPI